MFKRNSVGLLFVLIFVLSNVFIYFLLSPNTKRVYELTNIPERSIREMHLWPKVVLASRNPNNFVTDPNGKNSFDFQYFNDCWQDKNWLRMYTDQYCLFLWMQSLENGNVKSIQNILSVITTKERKLGEKSKSNQNGGMKCVFDSLLNDLKVQAYWKPCTPDYLSSNSESFKSEIIAFHIDRVLAFYRTPPVIPMYFTANELHQLAKEAQSRKEFIDVRAMYKVQTVLDKCGNSKGVEGAMVGWSNIPVRPLDG